MAKAKSIAERLAGLPKQRHGVALVDIMTAQQKSDFNEALEWWHNRPRLTRPTRRAFAEELSSIVGMELSENTLARYLVKDGYSPKKA
jgi:hypothetical protein